ncbi:MAG: hypothetical protein K2Q18_01910 [Bdellovibrionales bacterium]|nr:hypothetical protein [Bdellovibrionales bacterium]
MFNSMTKPEYGLSLKTVFFSWILVLITVALVKYDMRLFSVIFFIDVWLFSQPHVISTFFKQATFERFSKMQLSYILVAILLLLSAFFHFFGVAFLFSFYFYWQWFHYFRQNYGIALSEKHSFRKVETFFLHLMPILALLALASKGPLGFLNYYISFPTLPFSENFFRLFYLEALGVWGVFQIYSYKKGAFNFHSFINALSAYALYFWVYIYNEQFILGWLGMTFYHNAQYLIFNWRRKEFIRTYFEKTNLLIFYLVMTVASVVVYGIIKSLGIFLTSPFAPVGLILIFTFNMLHYVCDTVIWKGPVKSS